ncbi:MAG: hypothetical protein QOI47_1877, partial [Actinomycetota bacterium]|nr:hypothetical protein [Actinomycetota bacterium]
GIDGRVIIQPPASTADLRSNLTRAAALPERNRAVDAQLSLIVALADATVDGADGVSVTLRRSGRVSTVAASNDTVLRMDAHQYETGEGPCLSAASEGRAFHIESLSGESRWPAFVALALEQGIASILSTPLRAADETIGALNIYSNTERAFGSYQSELSEVLAAQASQFLTDAAAHPSDAEMAPRIAAALRSRLILAQAQGVLMARHRVSADEATNTLHRLARAAESSVLVHAAEVVASTYVGVDSIARLGHG